MSFVLRERWHCTFMEEDLRIKAAPPRTFTNADNMVEMIRCGNGFATSLLTRPWNTRSWLAATMSISCLLRNGMNGWRHTFSGAGPTQIEFNATDKITWKEAGRLQYKCYRLCDDSLIHFRRK
jgi:hypothetical protein